MDIHEVVGKLVGRIDPVGETNEDNRRFENLKIMADLVNKLLFNIDEVSREYSRDRAGKFAAEFFAAVEIAARGGE